MIIRPPDKILNFSPQMLLKDALSYCNVPYRSTVDSPAMSAMVSCFEKLEILSLLELQYKMVSSEEDYLIDEICKQVSTREFSYHEEHILRILGKLSSFLLPQKNFTNLLFCSNLILSTGDPLLDDVLGNGLKCGTLNEICGESSCGKTQLCLQFLVQCVCPKIMGGLDSRSCFITTENFPRSRLIELIKHRLETLQNYIAKVENLKFPSLSTVDHFLDRILVRDRVIYTVEEFNEVIYGLLKETVEKHPFRLLVVDSIAALYRTPISKGVDFQNRAKQLWNLSEYLRKLAGEFNICIILVNHVSDRFSDSYITPKLELTGGRLVDIDESTYFGSFDDKKPCLGLFWSSMVNSRIMVSRKKGRMVYIHNEFRATKRRKINNQNAVFVYKESARNQKNVREIQNFSDFSGNQQNSDFDVNMESKNDDFSKTSESYVEVKNSGGYHHRELKVIFSPNAEAGKKCHFVIDQHGVRGIRVQDNFGTGSDYQQSYV